jgi:hypothetical protein
MQDLLRRKEDEYIDWVRWRADVDSQLKRIISDQESEKGTRSRVNGELDKKLDSIYGRLNKQDKLLYAILGGIAVANTLIIIFVEVFKH